MNHEGTQKASHSEPPVRRFTVDLHASQRRFLKVFSIQYNLDSALTVRVLLYLLETNITFAKKVIDMLCFPTQPGATGKDAKTRLTVDLNSNQHRFLKVFAVENGFSASTITKMMLTLLESDAYTKNLFLSEFFGEDESEEP